MPFIIGIVLLTIVMGVLIVATRKKPVDKVDVYEVYKHFLDLAMAYREKNGHYAKDFEMLKALDLEYKGALKEFALSLDGKFLVVSGLQKDEAEKLINEIGGASYINGGLTYLTFERKNDLSHVIPVAHFSLKPEGKLTTTTPISYDSSGCTAENGEILEKKWENKRAVFSEPGTHVISLKIKDRNGNWSDAYEKEIKVVEETGIRSIETYDGSQFILYNSGHVLTNGKNEEGQLGVGTLNPVPEWTHSSLHDGTIQIACGESFNLFRMYDGTVYGAGNNRHGELATGDKTPQKVLSAIWGLENIKQIDAGKHFAAALDYNGNVFVWGDNDQDQIMDPDVVDATSPVKLRGVEGVKQIACGSNFGLALRYDGTVVGWGDNSFGQLGVGYKGSINEPVVTMYQNIKSVYAGDRFSLAVTENGRVYVSGNNTYAQLGIKGKNEVFFPEELMGIKDVETIKVRESLVLAITKTGKAYVWGNFNTPAQKPIYTPTELQNISYVKVCANNGKKLYIIDSSYTMHVVSDLSGKYEQIKIHASYHDFVG